MDESHQPLRTSLADRRADCERKSVLRFDADEAVRQIADTSWSKIQSENPRRAGIQASIEIFG